MKARKLSLNEGNALESALQEQLALRKLKRIQRREKLWRLVNWLRSWGLWLRRADLVREVAPHRPPLRRHEWEEPIQKPWSL